MSNSKETLTIRAQSVALAAYAINREGNQADGARICLTQEIEVGRFTIMVNNYSHAKNLDNGRKTVITVVDKEQNRDVTKHVRRLMGVGAEVELSSSDDLFDMWIHVRNHRSTSFPLHNEFTVRDLRAIFQVGIDRLSSDVVLDNEAIAIHHDVACRVIACFLLDKEIVKTFAQMYPEVDLTKAIGRKFSFPPSETPLCRVAEEDLHQSVLSFNMIHANTGEAQLTLLSQMMRHFVA